MMDRIHMRMRMIRNSRQLWSRSPPSPRCLAPPPSQPRGFRTLARTVPATPKRIRQAIHTTESKKTVQRRRFGPAYLRALSAERRPTNCRTRRAEEFFSNIIFTAAEHNELHLRPLVPRKQKSGTQPPCPGAPKTHDWALRKYECCLAVVERPYGNAPSSAHHQHPSDVAVGI
ncbi:BQ5605_C035g11438 [Microbotryum silenes-dioicae]|uniref:BQ5605_C035g11438 protein n=1 Tax=Microbotryum silenes-dioicae TaxID=796604 RepID=A0A2X0N2H1_9BASI|nr:BQ5605_C035g11438 [Microbotryum silenes-dioicae]